MGAVRRGAGRLLEALRRPVPAGRWLLPPIGEVILAAVGAVLLAVVATASWNAGSDELSYWGGAQRLLAGLPLYDPAQTPVTPYAYWYSPPTAQVLAPFTTLISPETFTVIWTVFLLGCLWWLGGRSVVGGLALIAFLPVAVELRTRNVHLLLAVLTVLALRRSWVFWVVGAAIKITPALGALYLAASGRWRQAAYVAILGAVVLGVSVVASPGAWRDWLAIALPRISAENGGVVPIPFGVRFAVGAAMTVVAGRMGGRRGEVLLALALTVANPTWWVTAFSLPIAIVALWRSRPAPEHAVAERLLAPEASPA